MTPPLQILPLAPKHERALSQLFFELNARRAVPGLEAFRTHAAVRAFADSTYARPVSCLACVATPADADMIVGAAFVHFPGAELSYMVSPAHWRQGVGAALVQEVMTRCREQLGLSEIHAIVSTRKMTAPLKPLSALPATPIVGRPSFYRVPTNSLNGAAPIGHVIFNNFRACCI